MRTYMLDTDICSYIMRKEAAVHRRLLEELRAGSKIVISATTYSELLFGAKMPKTPKRWLDALDIFLANGAISRAQYDKSLGDLTKKMGMDKQE